MLQPPDIKQKGRLNTNESQKNKIQKLQNKVESVIMALDVGNKGEVDLTDPKVPFNINQLSSEVGSEQDNLEENLEKMNSLNKMLDENIVQKKPISPFNARIS